MSTKANRTTAAAGAQSLTAALAPSRKAPAPFVSGFISIQRADGGFVVSAERQHHTNDTAVAVTLQELVDRVVAWAMPPAAPATKPARKR